MTREELRVALDVFCGCGRPEDAASALLRLLRLHPLYDHHDEFEEWMPDSGISYLILYWLCDQGLTEHGGSVLGGWLTEKGEAIRDALAREETDQFKALFEPHCIHGFALFGSAHLCSED